MWDNQDRQLSPHIDPIIGVYSSRQLAEEWVTSHNSFADKVSLRRQRVEEYILDEPRVPKASQDPEIEKALADVTSALTQSFPELLLKILGS